MGQRLMIIPYEKMIAHSEVHTCDYHKMHPDHHNYAGCTCFAKYWGTVDLEHRDKQRRIQQGMQFA